MTAPPLFGTDGVRGTLDPRETPQAQAALPPELIDLELLALPVGAGEIGVIRDRRRDNRGVVGRIWSLRYGFAETFGSPCDVAAEVAIVLSDRGWTGTPRRCGPGCPLRDGLPERSTWAAS